MARLGNGSSVWVGELLLVVAAAGPLAACGLEAKAGRGLADGDEGVAGRDMPRRAGDVRGEPEPPGMPPAVAPGGEPGAEPKDDPVADPEDKGPALDPEETGEPRDERGPAAPVRGPGDDEVADPADDEAQAAGEPGPEAAPDDEAPQGEAGPDEGAGPLDEPAIEEEAPVREPARTVLLVPGTGIPGGWFGTMAERLAADGYEPLIWEAPGKLEDGLALGAAQLDAVVDRVLAETGEPRISVVAECNGGVAARYWAQVLGGHDRIDQLVTFVAAHHGSTLSPAGAWLHWQSLDDVRPGSAFLEELDAAPFPDGLRLTSIWTCRDELLLPRETSVVDGAVNVQFCDRAIRHFDGFWDVVVYDRIVAALRGAGAEAGISF